MLKKIRQWTRLVKSARSAERDIQDAKTMFLAVERDLRESHAELTLLRDQYAWLDAQYHKAIAEIAELKRHPKGFVVIDDDVSESPSASPSPAIEANSSPLILSSSGYFFHTENGDYIKSANGYWHSTKYANTAYSLSNSPSMSQSPSTSPSPSMSLSGSASPSPSASPSEEDDDIPDLNPDDHEKTFKVIGD